MKKVLVLLSASIMFLLLAVVSVQADQSSLQPPPVAQPLVREGDFAISLTNALKIGEVSEEAQAESMLNAVGIAPKNGWIADYPVTPDVLGEIGDSISLATATGRLAMSNDNAVAALNKTSEDFGIYTSPSTGDADSNSYTGTVDDSYGANIPPQDYGSNYANPTTINNYYYDYGPPVISYYPPPWDYSYMYSWVPYPFWWNSFWFPGFFALSDFDRVIIVRDHDRDHHRDHNRDHHGDFDRDHDRKIISNHVFDREGRTVKVINPEKRRNGEIQKGGTDFVNNHGKKGNSEINKGRTGIVQRKGFTSTDAKNGASSIWKRSYERKADAVRTIRTDRNPGSANALSGSRQGREGFTRQQPSFSRPVNSNTPPRISPQRPAMNHGRPYSSPGNSNTPQRISPQGPAMNPGRSYSPPGNSNTPQRISPQGPVMNPGRPSGIIRGSGGGRALMNGFNSGLISQVSHGMPGRSSGFHSSGGMGYTGRFHR